MGSTVDGAAGAEAVEVGSEAFETFSAELHELIDAEGYGAATSRLLEDRKEISCQLSPDELTELVETTFNHNRHGGYSQTIRPKGVVLAAYATEYFTTFGTNNSVMEAFKDERRAAAFAMQSRALEYAFGQV